MYAEDQQLAEQIRKGSDKALLKVYRLYRTPYQSWIRKLPDLSQEVVTDAFQDGLAALDENLRKGVIQQLEHPLKDYLFALSNKMIELKLGAGLPSPGAYTHVDTDRLVLNYVQQDTMNEREEYVTFMLEHLPEPGKSILRQFHFYNLPEVEIAKRLKIKSTREVNAIKMRILFDLKKEVNDKFRGENSYAV